MNGYPNLKLFNHLYWLSLLTLVINGYILFPFSKQLEDNFPQNSIKGQICTKIDFQMDQTNGTQRLLSFIFPCIFAIFNFRHKRSMLTYSRGQNLGMKTFSQFGGKHQRNIFTAQQTSNYFIVTTIIVLLENSLIIVFQLNRDQINKDVQFLIHNFIWIFFIECFFGLYVPLKHLLLSRECMPGLWLDEKAIKTSKFYVRNDQMIPRRHIHHALKCKEKPARQHQDSCSYLHKSTKTKVCEKPQNIVVTQSSRKAMDPLTPISI